MGAIKSMSPILLILNLGRPGIQMEEKSLLLQLEIDFPVLVLRIVFMCWIWIVENKTTLLLIGVMHYMLAGHRMEIILPSFPSFLVVVIFLSARWGH